jgi:hypothetical protein
MVAGEGRLRDTRRNSFELAPPLKLPFLKC